MSKRPAGSRQRRPSVTTATSRPAEPSRPNVVTRARALLLTPQADERGAHAALPWRVPPSPLSERHPPRSPPQHRERAATHVTLHDSWREKLRMRIWTVKRCACRASTRTGDSYGPLPALLRPRLQQTGFSVPILPAQSHRATPADPVQPCTFRSSSLSSSRYYRTAQPGYLQTHRRFPPGVRPAPDPGPSVSTLHAAAPELELGDRARARVRARAGAASGSRGEREQWAPGGSGEW